MIIGEKDMLNFYYNPKYKYTNRTIIDTTGDSDYTSKDYLNIDSPDTINGHIVYVFGKNETRIPSYIKDSETGYSWFVTGITPVSSRKKFQISLLRDVISENPSLWANEQNAYVAAGLAAANNYNKYKRWGLPFTNTKVGQQRLAINGESSFYVFYVNEQQVSSSTLSEQDLIIKYSTIPGITNVDYTVNNLSSIPSYEYVGVGQRTLFSNIHYSLRTIMYTGASSNPQMRGAKWDYNASAAVNSKIGQPDIYNPAFSQDYIYIKTSIDNVYGNVNNSRYDMETAITNFSSSYIPNTYNTITSTAISNLAPYVNKVILDSSTNKVYTIRLNESNGGTLLTQLTQSETTTLGSALASINWPYLLSDSRNYEKNGKYVSFSADRRYYTYTLEELGTATSLDFTFKADVRKLPKSAVRCVNIAPTGTVTKEEMAQALMLAQTNGINPDNTTGRILDIQYLPFTIASSTNNNIKINNTAMTAEFLELDDFQYNIDLPDLTNINKETDTIKIVSPSRASQYLFKPYDNDGNMEFAAKITLKPYTSTIYVRPSTKGLLMQDWDDKDCLIIQEDMSLTNVTSEWTNYVYSNKNFQNAFERQIQGREFERGWERRVEEAQMRADDWTGRNISAEKSRTYSFNLPIFSDIAAAAGAIIQGPDQDYMRAAQIDRQYNEAVYQEGLSLSRDMFNYQLDNIKSQPLIPSKITTIDCKFLDGVYLEFYSTNPTELAAIASYYEYNGNRIDDYGTFADYWGNFIRGKLIKTMNYTQPETDELNRRLSMGIFTGGITL